MTDGSTIRPVRDSIPETLAAAAEAPKSAAAGFRVALTGDYERLALQVAQWGRLGADTEVVSFPEPFASPQAIVESLRDFDAVTLMRERVPLTRDIMAQLPRLRMVVFCGRANETLDDVAAAELGIVVCNSNGDLDGPPGAAGGKSPAELAVALMLACAWQIEGATALIRDGGWAFRPGIPLRGKTLGIVGYGDIGRAVAKTALALGMEVLASGRSLTGEAAQRDGVNLADLDVLLERSDVVSIHLRLAPETRSLINADRIARMKDGVIFINTARAHIVEEEPFLAALLSRKIGMAGLDVFWEEPLPKGHLLTELSNVVMTPHIGYATREAIAIRYQAMLDTVLAYRQGRPVQRYVASRS